MPICRCSRCSLLTYLDYWGVIQRGQQQSSKISKQHFAEDRLRRMAEEEAQATVEGTILLETLKDSAARPGDQLPVRPNDLPSRDSHAVQGKETNTAKPNPAVIRERITLVARLNSGRDLRSAPVPDHPNLQFQSPPASPSDPPGELDGSKGDNLVFRNYRDWLREALWAHGDLGPVGDCDADNRYVAEVCKLRSELQRLTMIEAVAWNRLIHENLYAVNLDPTQREPDVMDGALVLQQPPAMKPFILAGLLMTTILHSLASVSFPQASYMLATLRTVLFGALTFSYVNPLGTIPHCNALQEQLLKGIPLDIRTVIDMLHLDPDIVTHACCPNCSQTYPPDKNNPLDPYPHHCTHRETDRPVCGTLLVKKQLLAPKHAKEPWRQAFRALRTYPYRSLKSWLAELLGRPGYADMLKKSWDRPSSSTYHDIMDAPGIREFRGPDGVTYFSVQPDGSLHLVFSLFVDWFNPYGNKKAGKSHSIGVIYLALLNLPPHLRYRPENIFLAGIIPGPKEPQLHELNNLLRPLVDDLLELWNTGVYILQATGASTGCLVRAALIPLVCDLPASRKTAGFASYKSTHFCSFCTLPLDRISDVERSTWPPSRTPDVHVKIAWAWLNAPTEAARRTIFDDHGIRWSELLRLPYWDPTRYAVLDVMHNLFLGELQHHCREVWKLDTVGTSGSAGGSRQVTLHGPQEQQAQLDRIFSALKRRDQTALIDVRKDYLSAVARYNQAVGYKSKEPTKREYAVALLQWAAAHNYDFSSFRLPPVLEQGTKKFYLPLDEQPEEVLPYMVFTRDVLDQVRKDVESVVLPSWVEKIPSGFGGPGHGKLKADHWRTACVVNMVITLVRLWGTASASPQELEALKNFLHLIIAVNLASRRSMTEARAAAYDHHMEQYLRGLRRLYNHKLVPNHHFSLHLKPFLQMFGPVHGWWAFAFERYNGLLQRMKTNFKAAEMPKTFMRYFYMGSTLRWLMRITPWPKMTVFDEMVQSFEAAFSDRVRGTRVTDILSFGDVAGQDVEYDHHRESPLSQDTYAALIDVVNVCSLPIQFQSTYGASTGGQPRLHPAGMFVSTIHHDGVRFGTKDGGERDSHIIYRGSELLKAGRIAAIFYHQRMGPNGLIVEPFFVVEPYLALSPADAVHDPYRRFPELDTQLYYNTFEDAQNIVSTNTLVSHFAAFVYKPEGINKDCIVARSLDRVRVH